MNIKIVKWPFSKVYSLTKGVNDGIQSSAKIGSTANSGIVYITKITGATTGTAGAVKGTVDALEALACQDGICFAVSCVGTVADSLQICASFVPGSNVTALVTTPISVGCKVFVWCCKKSKLRWKVC